MLVKIVYQVATDNGPLIFPIESSSGKSLLQIFPGANNIDTELWNEIKDRHTTRLLLEQRKLYSPDSSVIIEPPKARNEKTKYKIIDAREKPFVIPSEPVPETKPVRVASKLAEKTVGEETNPKTKTSDSKAKTKFHGGVSSPSSE